MSHFTKVNTKMMVAEYLVKSLADLGYTVETGDVKVRGFMQQKTTAEIKVKASWGYDIGFRKGKSGYEMIADWYGIKGTSKKKLVQQLSQRYAYHAAIDKLTQQGFDVSGEEVDEDGRIHLTLRRMA